MYVSDTSIFSPPSPPFCPSSSFTAFTLPGNDDGAEAAAELSSARHRILPIATPRRCTILHIDMDCFFASVSLLACPELKNDPVAVGHATSATSTQVRESSTSELSSVNYPARTYGIHAGMYLGKAVKLCPQLKVGSASIGTLCVCFPCHVSEPMVRLAFRFVRARIWVSLFRSSSSARRFFPMTLTRIKMPPSDCTRF